MNRLQWIRQALVTVGLVLTVLAVGIARVEARNCTAAYCNTATCFTTVPASSGGPGCQTGACTGGNGFYQCEASDGSACGCVAVTAGVPPVTTCTCM